MNTLSKDDIDLVNGILEGLTFKQKVAMTVKINGRMSEKQRAVLTKPDRKSYRSYNTPYYEYSGEVDYDYDNDDCMGYS